MREMKDSGIEWIGEIPKDWEIIKGKYVLEYLQKPVKDDDGVITCFRDGEVTLRSNRREDGFTLSDKEIGYQGIDVGDLVVHGMDGFAGAIGISDSRGKASPVLNVLNSKYNKRYLMYYLRSMAFSNVFVALASGIRVRSCDLRWNKLAELPYPTTSYDEQTEIVNYIDSKCSEIDATAEDIQKEISLLEDYKKSVITEAVTKGLNPDAEMKDSGIEWIGEIPKEWTVKNLKYIFDITSGSTPASGVSQYWDGDIKWITPADFKTNDVYVFGGRRNITGLGLMSCSTQVIPDSSIIFSKRAPIGSVVITGEKMCINQGCLALISKHQKTSVKFYYYALSILDKIFDMLGNGTTFKEISAFRFSNTSLQCPRFEEQQQIADYLDTKCSEIDTLIADKKRQLDILADYKKSLIYEYVTGKKEVPVNE